MKKLITICLLLATAFTANAKGGKLTKEQTLTYLSKTFALSEGETFLSWQGTETVTYRKSVFSINNISNLYDVHYNDSNKSDTTESSTSSDIKWETADSLELKKGSNNMTNCVVHFSSKLMNDGYFFDFLNLNVLTTKAESFKKALERLIEIAKEENKDPFQN